MKRLSLCLTIAAGILLFGIGVWMKAQEAVVGEFEILLCNSVVKDLEMKNSWEAAKAAGVKGIEVHVDPDLSCPHLTGGIRPYNFEDRDEASRLGVDGLNNGIMVPVVVAPIQLNPREIEEKGAPEWALTLIRSAPFAGVKLIYFPIVTENFTETTIPDDRFIELSVYLLNDLVAESHRSGVAIALENLSVYWNRPEVLQKVLAEFSDEELGLCLDPINFYWFGHPKNRVYDLVRDFLPRTWHFHAKNLRYPVRNREEQREPGWKYAESTIPVDEGDLDFEQLVGYMLDAGFNGYISIEDDSLGKLKPNERLKVLKREIEYLRKVTAGYRGRN